MTTGYPTAHRGLVKVVAAISYGFAALAGGVIITGPVLAALGVSFSGLVLGSFGFGLNLRDAMRSISGDDDAFQRRSKTLELAMFFNLAIFLYLLVALLTLFWFSVGS